MTAPFPGLDAHECWGVRDQAGAVTWVRTGDPRGDRAMAEAHIKGAADVGQQRVLVKRWMTEWEDA